MRRLHHTALTGFLAFCFVVTAVSFGWAQGGGQASKSAADRRVVLETNADYPGGDFRTLKNTTLPKCQAACLANGTCKGFTFNSRARWCFLKSKLGKLVPAKGAVAGRVTGVARAASSPEEAAALAKKRTGELGFLPKTYLTEADNIARTLGRTFKPGNADYQSLLERADEERDQNRYSQAANLLGRALAINSSDRAIWRRFAETLLEINSSKYNVRRFVARQSTGASINAYLRAETADDRAGALALLARSFVKRKAWKPAIRSYRAALALEPNEKLRSAYDAVVAQHGFRIISHDVSSDAQRPRICIKLSDALPRGEKNLADYVTADPGAGLAVEPNGNQICISGVKHGERYAIKIRAGLPSHDGEQLVKTADLSVYVRDRKPWAGFAGKAYVLPRGGDASIPVTSVNTERLKAAIYRIGERALAGAISGNFLLRGLNQSRANEIAEQRGEKVWEGTVEVKSVPNRNVTTAIPVTRAIAKIKPGIYVIVAHPAESKPERWDAQATQWFVVSDLGLTALKGHDGVHVYVRALGSAAPARNVKLKLVALNQEILGEGETDAQGYAHFQAGLVRGVGGLAPRVLVAQDARGDYAFLDFATSAFDLTDRGVEGRAAPPPIDVYLKPDRGVYRPGETVHLTALMRDANARAIKGLNPTVVVMRPDGVENRRAVIRDSGLGGHVYALKLQANAMRGAWRVKLYADPKGDVLAETSVLVEDFVPERLAFELKSSQTRFTPGAPVPVEIDARYLYGAPAAKLSVNLDVEVKPVNTAKRYPGYRFGLDDDPVKPTRRPLKLDVITGDNGHAAFRFEMPALAKSTRLFEATIIARLNDSNGRAVERTLTRPVTPGVARIAVKPLFDDDVVPEGAQARFEVIAIDADGARIEAAKLAWVLERVRTEFQWYQANGRWQYEPVTSTERVANGTVDVAAGEPASLAAPVKWGRYRLRVAAPDGQGEMVPASISFSRGWHATGDATETPDFLTVSSNKDSYQPGETIQFRLSPRFAGRAVISVMSNRLIARQEVEIGSKGAVVPVKVTEQWGAGAYVVAHLFRPMDIAARRMPGRALGLKWMKVDPARRQLKVTLKTSDKITPRGALEVPVEIGNLKPGAQAYVTVAAVDVGILNLTNYQPPDPSGWYYGQRKLGVEIRDLYGRLIDRMRGEPGRIRSGGDDDAVKLKSPPPTQKLVAFFSGPVRIDRQGRVRVQFDIPDFNGTVRVMAMAWSSDGVGQAQKDVIVRDPVVVTASSPRFLSPGDKSRLFIEIANLDGEAGDYELGVSADAPVAIASEAAMRTMRLEKGARVSAEVPVTGARIGVAELRIALKTPQGAILSKALTLAVEPAASPVTMRRFVELRPQNGRLRIDGQVLHNLLPGTARASLAISPAGRLDVAGMLVGLDRYPHGCTEQITSRALPLVYLDDVAASIGLAADKAVKARVQAAIAGVLANQSSAGAFGLWRPSSGDFWLDAYVTDFITRAREKGYAVPKIAYTQALDNLANRVSYASDFKKGGEDIAYALYVLARNGRAAIGDLRYFAQAKLGAFATPLAKAQIGAALALYGEHQHAREAFRAGLRDLEALDEATKRWRKDYGSNIRDASAVLTLVSESKVEGIDLASLALRIGSRLEQKRYTSTQEKAWSLLAAHALLRDAGDMNIALDGVPVKGALFRKYNGADLAATPVVVENRGSRPLHAVITTTGIPATPGPAEAQGYEIRRAYFRPDGTPVDIAKVKQNDRFVVVLTVTAEKRRAGRLVVVDPLPAGFEIDNPNLTQSGALSSLGWLKTLKQVEHIEARTNRFVAAVTRASRSARQFAVAYMVRAVSPGVFHHPAATVEDMYQPDRRGNTAAGQVEIAGLPR